MKLERVGLNSNKNEVRKEKNVKNNFTMTKFGLPKMQKGNLSKDVVSFGSPVGSEAEGLSDELLNMANKFFTIKMQNKVESLNLSVAASIVFYSL